MEIVYDWGRWCLQLVKSHAQVMEIVYEWGRWCLQLVKLVRCTSNGDRVRVGSLVSSISKVSHMHK